MGSSNMPADVTGHKSSDKFAFTPVEIIMLMYSVLYALVSRMPFGGCFVMYMMSELEFDYELAGMTLALYCFGRLCGAHACGTYVGSATLTVGTLSGGAAVVAIILLNSRASFIVACYVLGLTETVTGVDVILKIESMLQGRSAEQTQIIFRCQLITTCVGVFIGYIGGGFLYEQFGMEGVATVILGATAGEILLLMALFLKQPLFRKLVLTPRDLEEANPDLTSPEDGVPEAPSPLDDKDRHSVVHVQSFDEGRRHSEQALPVALGTSASDQARITSKDQPRNTSKEANQSVRCSHRASQVSQASASGFRRASQSSQWVDEQLARRQSRRRCTSVYEVAQVAQSYDHAMRPSACLAIEAQRTSRRSSPTGPVESAARMHVTLLYAAVACFFFTTIGISTQFAICAVYWQGVWGAGPGVAGTLMAIGEGGGVLLLLFFGQPAVFRSRFTRPFGKPANICLACAVMAGFMFLVTADSVVACALATICIHVCNVLIHSFQAELVGVVADGHDEFAYWISKSYVVKRLANVVCVGGSLVFYDILGPQLSYQCVAVALFAYASALSMMFLIMGLCPHQRQAFTSEVARRDSI
jgi:hypothetical protein